MSVTVYSLPNCVACENTKRMLDRGGVDYNVIDMSKDEDAFNMVKDLGYQAAPVVVTDEDHWGGFEIDKITALYEATA